MLNFESVIEAKTHVYERHRLQIDSKCEDSLQVASSICIGFSSACRNYYFRISERKAGKTNHPNAAFHK